MRDDDIRKRLEISDEDLIFWMERLRPVVRFNVDYSDSSNMHPLEKKDTGIPFWIEPVDPRKVAFTWEPKPTKIAQVYQVGHMITYHRFGAPSLFKPSIAEVIAQIIKTPVPDGVIAFETGNGDLSCVNVYNGAESSWHWCPTILYAAEPAHRRG
jgi:hypothetical protein